MMRRPSAQQEKKKLFQPFKFISKPMNAPKGKPKKTDFDFI